MTVLDDSRTLDTEAIDALTAFTVMLEISARLLRAPASIDDLAFFKAVDLDDSDDPVCADRDAREGLALMQAYAQASNDMESLRQRASDDFHRMFVGPGHKSCPPWSSVYLDGKRLVNGPTALRVKAAFKERGLAAPVGTTEPWDHIAFEMQFVADLQKRAFTALDDGDVDQARSSLSAAWDFSREFIVPWANSFFSDVETNARVDFYRGLARMSGRAIELDARAIERALVDSQQ